MNSSRLSQSHRKKTLLLSFILSLLSSLATSFHFSPLFRSTKFSIREFFQRCWRSNRRTVKDKSNGHDIRSYKSREQLMIVKWRHWLSVLSSLILLLCNTNSSPVSASGASALSTNTQIPEVTKTTMQPEDSEQQYRTGKQRQEQGKKTEAGQLKEESFQSQLRHDLGFNCCAR